MKSTADNEKQGSQDESKLETPGTVLDNIEGSDNPPGNESTEQIIVDNTDLTDEAIHPMDVLSAFRSAMPLAMELGESFGQFKYSLKESLKSNFNADSIESMNIDKAQGLGSSALGGFIMCLNTNSGQSVILSVMGVTVIEKVSSLNDWVGKNVRGNVYIIHDTDSLSLYNK